MAIISGARTNAIYKIGSTYGTAVSGGAGNKLKAEITPNFNVNLLSPRQIGSGAIVAQTATRGDFKPTFSLAMDAGYRNCFDNILAQFMGTAAAPSEQTVGQGDYKHTITLNSTMNAKYGTLAYESASATVVEAPSTCTQSISIELSDSPGILNFTAELLANNALITGTTNTNASMASATATDTEVIAFNNDDTFQINLNSGGSLSGSDNLAITSLSLKLNRPQQIMGEIRGVAGNSEPVETDLFDGELTITTKGLVDHTYFTYWYNETALKAKLNIQGTQIGSGVNKSLTVYLPKLLLTEEPKYALTSPGVNPVTMTFKVIGATANPTGMSSFYPYFEIINGLSTSLLA